MRIATTVFFLIVSQFLFSQSVSNCLRFKNIMIVVIGSSTAQGAGASTPDSAWVNRYRKFVQNINPQNEVVNLARGGYNTYRLMPHEFVPPPGRPTQDSTRNITAAVAQSPDAIILNLPSNDASSGFSAGEQLMNFDSIAKVATSAGIPIWIATTQPKNFNNDALINVQIEVRDSIFSWFGDRAIDFWTGLADSNGELDSDFDSGDGTHLNDAGHRLIFERVVAKNIPEQLVVHPTLPDYAIIDFSTQNEINCSADEIFIELVYTNFGQSSPEDELDLIFQLSDSVVVENIETPESCELDTLTFETFDVNMGATILSGQNNDPILINNFSQLEIEVLLSPQLEVSDFGICAGESIQIHPSTNISDRIFWYEYEDSTNPISSDSFLNLGPLTETTSMWVEAFNGDPFYKNELFTTDQFNRDWNGIMFDLVANEELILDSFSVNMFSIGEQILEIYLKNGSLIGSEMDADQWMLYKMDTLQVASSGDYVMVGNIDLSIAAGDTIAIYLQLQNSASDMNYLATSINETISDAVLSLTNGTGITHNFAQTYFPRLFSGELFYHHGERLGDCSSGRQEVVIEVGDPEVDLGSDIVIASLDTIFRLDAGNGFSSYTWSDGSTTSSIEIFANEIVANSDSLIFVTVFDEFGCVATDTVYFILKISDIEDTPLNYIKIFPNPFNDFINLSGIRKEIEFSIFNLEGKLLLQEKVINSRKIDVSDCTKGVYILRVELDGQRKFIRLVKQ